MNTPITTLPDAARIEILNGVQDGPARVTGREGTRLDFTNAYQMTFWVQVVFVDDARLTLMDDASYEAAIIEAERAAIEWGVPVHDLVRST